MVKGSDLLVDGRYTGIYHIVFYASSLSQELFMYISLIFTTFLWKRDYLHFTDKETEARVVKKLAEQVSGGAEIWLTQLVCLQSLSF